MPHRSTASALVIASVVALASCGDVRKTSFAAATDVTGCTRCHGGIDNQTGAPPHDVQGKSDTALVSVGAHSVHVQAANVAGGFACTECHPDPRAGSTKHMNGTVDLAFGPVASGSGSTPSFDGGSARCSNVYCHGAFKGGNASAAPVWTQVDHTQATCGTCHGDPGQTPSALPRTNHAALAPGSTNATCSVCHPGTVDANGNVLASGGMHVNGAVDTDPAAKHPSDWLIKSSPNFHGRVAAQDIQLCQRCHAARPPAKVTTVVCSTCHDFLAGNNDWTTTCNSCHGSAANAAPPKDTLGNSDTSALGVGAHQAHVTAPQGLSAPLDCVFCHQKPSNVYDAGHLDGQVTVTGYTGFDANWIAAGKDPGFSASSASCSTSYCHGAFLGGNATNAPVWTKVGTGQAACGSCHGLPPAQQHPTVLGGLSACNACHPDTVDPSGNIISPAAGGKHLDGRVEFSGGHDASWMDQTSPNFHAYSADCGLGGCQGCHGNDLSGGFTGVACSQCHGAAWKTNCTMCHGGNDNQTGAPPRTTWGNGGDPVRTGAHTAHVAGSAIAPPFDCDACHVKPADALAAGQGHIDNATATVTWGGLAKTGGANPVWDRASATCSNTYCHGGFAFGKSSNLPVWTSVGQGQAACGTCHDLPPGNGHPQNSNCASCHIGYTISSVNVATHLNGVPDVANLTCTSCHGDATRQATSINPQIAAAPPMDTHGNVDPSSPGVGAHQLHLAPGAYGNGVPCTECHTVPTSTSHPTGTVTFSWGPLATHGPTWPGSSGVVTPVWNGTTCSASYCHGNFRNGNTTYAPTWTSPASNPCGTTCHANPPPAPIHPATTNDCGACHPGYSTTTVNASTHVDGNLEVTLSCSSCHGTPTRTPVPGADANVTAAPPVTATGRSAGAHLAHVNKPGGIITPAQCAECHSGAVPSSLSNHPSGTNTITVAFSGRATIASGDPPGSFVPAPTYDPSVGCSATYCHGNYSGTYLYTTWDWVNDVPVSNTIAYAGNAATPTWTGAPMACDSCHGNPPPNTGVWHSGAHGGGNDCSLCHPDAMGVPATGTSITNPSQHVNGNIDVAPKWTSTCFNCH